MGLFLYAISRSKDENIMEVGIAVGDSDREAMESIATEVINRFLDDDIIRLIEITDEYNLNVPLQWVDLAYEFSRPKKHKNNSSGKKGVNPVMNLYVYKADDFVGKKHEVGVLVASDEDSAWDSLTQEIGKDFDEYADVELFEVAQVGDYDIIVKEREE